MKRMHVHVAVENLQDNIRFYSSLFGSAPNVAKEDYAKWMLDDPRVNFAISTRGHQAGVNHLGFQVDSDDELRSMRAQLEAADGGLVEQTGTACCYAQSDKYWITDPQGIAWETFHSLGTVPVYGEDTVSAKEACCIPLKQRAEQPGTAACCVPSTQRSETAQDKNICCG
ncbi:MAG TPA: ArsI/CadI family heavy metal resistance metalloenzyme [Gammaproteobacteria bacterium]|nr:ArsI/CadI family heavy metal resistance metalloenzyme [Gammaproteobacteria bacterium]